MQNTLGFWLGAEIKYLRLLYLYLELLMLLLDQIKSMKIFFQPVAGESNTLEALK